MNRGLISARMRPLTFMASCDPAHVRIYGSLEALMQYFVTGATGFIGKRLVKKLLGRKGSVVHFLIRRESEGKVAALRKFWGASAARTVPVFGDLTAKKLGVSADTVRLLKGQIDHFYHLAAVYDLA